VAEEHLEVLIRERFISPEPITSCEVLWELELEYGLCIPPDTPHHLIPGVKWRTTVAGEP
jgi:hypothetical protein